MSVNTSTNTISQNIPPQIAVDDDVYYPSTVENYMPETNVHFVLISNLAVTLQSFLQTQNDNYVFGDIMFYYEEGNSRKFVAPDLMVCLGMNQKPSKGVFKLWEEKHVPQVIIEIASESTWLKDLTSKYALYQWLGVEEYYIFDPQYAFLPESLMAYHLIESEFVKIEIADMRIFSPKLKLELVNTGETLRLFNPEANEFLMTMEEMQVENERLKAELAKIR